MNSTEELREAILVEVKTIIKREGLYRRLDDGVDNILSKLKELNYQKVRSRPIMIAGEAAGNKDGPAMLKAVQIMVKEGYKYCEPIDIGGTNEDK